jgi:hypothetical protein
MNTKYNKNKNCKAKNKSGKSVKKSYKKNAKRHQKNINICNMKGGEIYCPTTPDDHDINDTDLNENCGICLDTMSNIKLIPCCHLFHFNCMLGWYNTLLSQGITRPTCPICRKESPTFYNLIHKIVVKEEDGKKTYKSTRKWIYTDNK